VLANNFLLGEPIVFAADRVKLADACWTNGDTAGNNDVSFGWAGADGWATHEVLALSAAAPLFVVDSFHFFFGTAYYELRETNAGLGTDPDCHYSLTAPRLCRAGADAILQFGQQKGLDCPLVGPVDSATGSGVCGDTAQYDTLDDAASALAANHASGDATCHTITMVSNAARTSVDFVLHASETATPIAPGDDPRTSYTLACPSPPDTPPPSPLPPLPSPPPFPPLPAPPPPTTGWFPSELGQSCTDACAANGLICDAGEGRAHMDQIDEASEYDAITATIQFGNVTGTTCTNGHVGLQWSSYPNYRPDGESDGVCGLSGTNPDGSYGYGCPTTAPGFYRICYCISARPAPPPTAPPPPLVPCQVDACTPFANASLAAAHCAAQPAENQCVVTGDDRTAGTRRSRRLSETMPSCPAATQTYTWVLATMARDCNSACAANGNTCVDGATTGNSAACLTEIVASLSPPITCGHVWDGDASSTMDPSYYPYSGGRCYYSDPSSSSPFTCTGSSSNKKRICPCAPPTPPPPPSQYVIVDSADSCAAAGLATVAEADCDAARTALGIASYQTGAGLGEPHGCIAVKNTNSGPYLAGKWQTLVSTTTCSYFSTFDCICQRPSLTSPPPPPALHALASDTDFQNDLRFNENIDRSITLSAESGLQPNDAVVYVPTTESTCANVLAIAASGGKHGGLLSADAAGGLAVVVNLQTGQYHACVAQQSASASPGRRLQATGGFGVSDFTLRTDVTLTVDPVGAGSVFACTCKISPPQTPPQTPPPSLPPPPSPPP
jgi:hypothetical protein